MIIKSFTAESAAAALKRVHRDMGGDAIVLRSVQLDRDQGRPTFEITACLERPTVAQSSRLLVSKARLDERLETAVATTAEAHSTRVTPEDVAPAPSQPSATLLSRLADLDLPPTIAARVAKMAGGQSGSDLEAALADQLSRELDEIISVKPKFKPGDVVVFVGPPGSGKSSMLGKLAARLVVFDRQRVTLCTLDRSKIGAFDELAWYGESLGAQVVDPRTEFKEIGATADIVTLIDTPAITADDVRLQALAAQIATLNPSHCVAVISALQRSSDITDLAASLKLLRPTHLAMTMLDLTNRYGSSWAAANTTGLRLSMITDAPGGESLVQSPDGPAMIHRMLRREASHEK